MIGGSAVLALASQAAGDTAPAQAPLTRAAAVLQVGDGNQGKLDGEMRLRGPGFEQTTVVNLQNNGNSYIVLITMQSFDDPSGFWPWQCSCSSYQLSPTSPPQQVANLVRLTSYKGNGERLCNHPKAATDGQNIVWTYGSDYMSNRTQTYAGAIDYMCRTLVAPVLVSNTPNENSGAPDIAYNSNGMFTAGYLATGGNNDTSYAFGLTLSKQDVVYSLTKTWQMPIVAPSNIGRPTIATTANRSFFCASKGNNRPAEQGIECAWLNPVDGTTLWKNVVVQPDRNAMQAMTGGYFGQPTLAKISDTRFALNAIESNAGGRNTNLKGSNLAHLYMLDAAGDAIVNNANAPGLAAHQTHSAVCAGSYGVSGEQTTAVISAAPTGIGRAEMIFVNYDQTQKAFSYDQNANKWPINWYGDSGHLANWYGRNPMRQGRDFLRCIGNVQNPGHGRPDGYMRDVETFFVAAVSGRVPGDYKNSLFLSLIPGKVDTVATPENPVPADTPPVPATDNTDQTPPATNTHASNGCSCNTPGQTSGNLAGGLVLFGLVLLGVRRRRS
jgi:MYXO-CTERM domain-containing protein